MSQPTAPRSRLDLPAVPPEQADAPVAAWREPVEIDTYEPEPPERLPMFLENRVYQGSSGAVYPLPFHDRISREKRPRSWDAVHLENRWLRLMVLPELGGRIHVGLDRTTGYDFFYRNSVIKPALVGLAGPWISGGVEFNWPQHHRPATFLPVDVEIERHDDGAVTVWCSDHDPFDRMKGMHGVTLHPDRAVLELRVRLHNRTDDVRTFLWWANVAARVHDDYQSFFPTDVTEVADHARRATTSFPRARGRYYGVDYPARVTPQDPDADRLDRYRNIPVPTSYMCVGSSGDFFGGYDHAAGAGFVHWADHRISPGKKQWTWGNDAFGRAWDDHLTDGDGPYVELMAGVYTDNQPDFAFLAPGETKAFSQFWFPLQAIGPAHHATPELAVSLHAQPSRDGDRDGDGRPGTVARVGVCVTAERPGTSITLHGPDGLPLWSTRRDLAPGLPLLEEVRLDGDLPLHRLELAVHHGGDELVRWRHPAPGTAATAVTTATEPPLPHELASAEELYLTGLHLAQYRHATRRPEPYWEEALRRDPGDSRSATALAARAHERGEFDVAEELLRRAIARVTALNANPYDGEPHYRLGRALVRLGRPGEAYDAFAKAAWNAAWRAPASFAMARLACREHRWADALDLLDAVLRHDTDHLAARDLRVLVLRRLGRERDADAQLADTLRLDPLDQRARHLGGERLTCDARTHLDVAAEYAHAGFGEEAVALLDTAAAVARTQPRSGVEPLAHYRRALLLEELGRPGEAAAARRAGAAADPLYCFPHGLDDAAALLDATSRAGFGTGPDDGRAAALLGTWAYDRRRRDLAIGMWRRAVAADPADVVSWRNLGIATYNVLADGEGAAECYRRARELAPHDARLLFEADQLAKRRGEPPAARLAVLAQHRPQATGRDDLAVELAHLLVADGRPTEAVQVLGTRRFQPWEGGEGQVLGAWERARLELARLALAGGDPVSAQVHARAALAPPSSLGEAPHPLANRSDALLVLGDALAAAGRPQEARDAWTAAATSVGDFQDMSVQPYSERTASSAAAWRRLGRHDRADELLDGLAAHARRLESTPAVVDYFATSLPALLLFADDARARRVTTARFLTAQVAAGRGEHEQARRLLDDVLQRDPNHCPAQDLRRLTA